MSQHAHGHETRETVVRFRATPGAVTGDEASAAVKPLSASR
ncbi:MAG: hypothetical protein ABI039_02600 [Vicinamibacterales bacterium]